MTHKLPPNLLALFAARPALRYLPPNDHAPEERKTHNIGGVAQYMSALKDYEDIPFEPTESWLQRKDRLKLEKKERQEKLLAEVKSGDDPQVRGDAYKTLFVARLSFDTTEKDLEREFGRFGPIERIRIVTDTHNADKMETESKPKKKKKPNRGYAFVVYEREKDMKAAYKETDGIRIRDRRVLVDVERGRTVKGWRPRRLGGGLGGRGYTKAMPARPAAPGGFAAPAGPGGFQGGGFRGGFGGGRGGSGGGGSGGGGFRGGFRGGDRGGFGGGRGGIGYQGGGGFGGGRGGLSGSPNGFGNGPVPPPNAPSGPGGNRGGFGSGGYSGSPVNGGMNGSGPPTDAANGARGGYGDPRRSSYEDRSSYRGGSSGGYGDRGDRSGGFTGSNREPVRPRDAGSYNDRDRAGGDRGSGDRDRYASRGRDDDHGSRKRYHDGEGYDDPRSKRRY